MIFSAAHTGRAINLDMTSAIAATAIHVDNAGSVRTGSDLLVTDDSTGTHNVIEINSSASGASTAFAWTDSYTGNDAAFGVKLTLDDADGLDATTLQVVRGTGIRTSPAIDINDASTGSADLIDIDLTGVFTGDVFKFNSGAAATGNAIFLDLDNAPAMTALRIEGSGTRTQPYIELISDSTGSAIYIDVDIDGAGSGNFIDIALGDTYTGTVLSMDMNLGVGAKAIYIDYGSGTRVVDLIDIKADGDGNTDVFAIVEANTGSGSVFDINVTGVGSGPVLDIVYSAADTGDAVKVVMANNVAGGALVITGTGTRSDSLIDVVSAETGSVDGMMLLKTTAVFTGHMLTVHSDAAATTGGLVHLDLDAGVAYKAITIDQAGARTVAVILHTADGTFASGGGGTFLDANISMTGAAASPYFDIDVSGVYTGNIFDVLMGSVQATGDVIKIDLGATAVASQAMVVASGNMIRSTALFQVTDAGASTGAMFDINRTAANEGKMFDIDDSGTASTGNVFDYAASVASTGTIFEVNMTNAVGAKLQNFTIAGIRIVDAITITQTASGSVDMFAIVDSGTSSGHIFDVNLSGNTTGKFLDLVCSGSKVAGDILAINLGSNLAGAALQITTAGVRTGPVILITGGGTDAAADDHIIDINQTGLLDSNVLDITYSSGVSTGNAIDLNMGSNVVGMAISVASAGTGVSGEGSCFDVLHTGNLASGADVMRLDSTGSLSSTSNVLSVIQRTGAGSGGAYAVHISATGDNTEALKVDDGAVVFDETLLVTGVATFTVAPVFSASIEFANGVTSQIEATTVETDTVTAADSGRVYVQTRASTTVTYTLPNAAAGLEYTFVCGDAASEILIDVQTGDAIVTKIHAAENGTALAPAAGTGIKNTAGTNVAGDYIKLACLDGTTWYGVGMTGLWASQ